MTPGGRPPHRFKPERIGGARPAVEVCRPTRPEATMIENDLKELYTASRASMRSRFNRDLPFDELLFDRWERAASLGFGAESSIYHLAYVYGDVRVGEHTWVGPYTLLD